jgi:putative ABC transport system substrate-binding protein
MKRRAFMTLLGSATAIWPFAARAQRASQARRIGFISGGSRDSLSDIVVGLPQGLQELGYVEGKDFIIEWRFAEGDFERIPGFAADLVQSKVDVFVLGTAAAIRPVQQATTTIPIVMGYSTDPVGNGFVASLAHPGGNITGLASSSDDTSPKQLELLIAAVPTLSHVGYLGNPANVNSPPAIARLEAAARARGLVVVQVGARSLPEIESAFTALSKERVGAIIVAPDALFMLHRKRITQLALELRLPSIFVFREFVLVGGLMSYGENLKEFFRRAATFVDKIFRGAKPGDLPIEQPTKFNLAINRKTANALAMTIPPQLFVFADEVIE